ncbi:hypothetical protein H632_c21p1 [Helicosporidium sp. ATCC 50920]|nr:hypothetical protein H632_c21p1 [Helicosporidium sp. ATCC 50920]|eukprot:KDD77093.1 hypothetical protein H632_c21p1 [Helicosporidium sp. ATCC 50920]
MADAQYTPVVLVACGSFNPPTVGHLRMLELARDAMCSLGADVLGAYLSPVGDAYWKPGLASAQHRVRMCELAAESSDFTMVDGWEAAQPTYTRSLFVLQRMQRQLAEIWAGGLPARSNTIVAAGSTVDAGSRNLTPPRTILVCGGDVLHSMTDPRAWKQDLLRTLLTEHGVVCITRDGSEILDLLNTPGTLVHELQEHITVVQEPIPSALSSTLVRQELAQNRSVKYFVADAVIQYVSQNRLYFCPAPAA